MSAPQRSPVQLGTFHATCWVLGLVAFVELVALGAALALREQSGQRPEVVERVVTEYVFDPSLAGRDKPGTLPAASSPVAARGPAVAERHPEIMALPEVAPAAPALTLRAPPIADPVVERLVSEARQARVADDMRLAIVKLEEAAQRAPSEPNMLYQFGEVFEAMGIYDRASDYYQEVFELGTTGAGVLYQLAARKLSDGFAPAERMEGKLAIGRIRQFKDTRVQEGEMVIIEIPIMAAPGQELRPEDVEVVVRFYDKLDGEIVPAATGNEPTTTWPTHPVDWRGANEEILRASYFIPRAEAQDLHLFGQRAFFGHIVELSYRGELLDQQAWPRLLARQLNAPERDPLFLPEDLLPQDLNEDNPLLPPLPR